MPKLDFEGLEPASHSTGKTVAKKVKATIRKPKNPRKHKQASWGLNERLEHLIASNTEFFSENCRLISDNQHLNLKLCDKEITIEQLIRQLSNRTISLVVVLGVVLWFGSSLSMLLVHRVQSGSVTVQDIIMSICGSTLAIAFVPQIYRIWNRQSADDISYTTCYLTTVALIIIGVCQFTLGLYFTMFSTFITTLMWMIVILQKLSYSPNVHEHFDGEQTTE